MTAGEDLGEQLISLFGGISLAARPLDEVGDLLIDGAAWLNDLNANELRMVLAALELGAVLVILHPDHPEAAGITTYLAELDAAERPVLAIAVPAAPPPPTVLLIDPTTRPPTVPLVDHRTESVTCPECGAVTDAALSADPGHPDPPVAGSVAVCASCAGVAIYTDAGQLRRPHPSESADLDNDPHITKVRAARANGATSRSTPMPAPILVPRTVLEALLEVVDYAVDQGAVTLDETPEQFATAEAIDNARALLARADRVDHGAAIIGIEPPLTFLGAATTGELLDEVGARLDMDGRFPAFYGLARIRDAVNVVDPALLTYRTIDQ